MIRFIYDLEHVQLILKDIQEHVVKRFYKADKDDLYIIEFYTLPSCLRECMYVNIFGHNYFYIEYINECSVNLRFLNNGLIPLSSTLLIDFELRTDFCAVKLHDIKQFDEDFYLYFKCTEDLLKLPNYLFLIAPNIYLKYKPYRNLSYIYRYKLNLF